MLYSLETGKPGFDKAFGMPLFEYIGQRPDLASFFSETMVGFHGQEPPAVARRTTFRGSRPSWTSAAPPATCWRRFSPAIPARAACCSTCRTSSGRAGAACRRAASPIGSTIEAGSFFDTVPAGGDCYVLSHVIHDWSEEQCLTILGHCRRAINPDGRLLIVEMVLPAGDTPHPGKLLDMVMLTFPGGQERTEAEYASLLGKAGFRLNRVVPTASAVSVAEASRHNHIRVVTMSDIRIPTCLLGSTELIVSRIGLGLAALGRPAYINLGRQRDLGFDRGVAELERRCHEMLDAAYSAGIRYVDAARSYGMAENFLDTWLNSRHPPKDAITVGSKWGYAYAGSWQLDAPVHEVKDLSIDTLRRQTVRKPFVAWRPPSALRDSLGDHREQGSRERRGPA